MCAQLPPPPSDERKKVVEDVDRDRRYSIDAAIVRTMKSRKVLQHTQASTPLPFWSLLIIACCCLGHGMYCNLGLSGWGSLVRDVGTAEVFGAYWRGGQVMQSFVRNHGSCHTAMSSAIIGDLGICVATF